MTPPWPRVKLGELGTMVRGSGIKRNETLPNGRPCLRYGEIYTSYEFILDKPRSFVSREIFDKSVHIKNGDLVLTLTGETEVEIAKALAYLGDEEIAAGGDLAVWSGHGCDPKYLAYLMYTPELIKAKALSSNGQIIVHISVKKIQQIEIPLPPLSVQHEIVARLEKELGAVDKLAKKFEELEQNAEAEFKSELKETFVKVLSDGVETRKLGDLCERVTKGTTPTSVGFSFIESGVNFVKVESFSDDGYLVKEKVSHVSMECHAALARSQLKKGDVLFSIAGALGRIAKVNEEILPANTNQALAIIRLKNDVEIGVDYLMLALRSPSVTLQVDDMKKETAQANLSLQNVRDFEIAFPPMAVQRSIVARIDAARERKEKLVSAAKRGREAAAFLRKAILKEAFE